MRNKAVFWDNDGVLVNTEVLYFTATRSIASTIGIEMDERQFHDFYLRKSGGIWHLAIEKGFSEKDVEKLRDKRNELYEGLLLSKNFTQGEVSSVIKNLHGRVKMGVVTSSKMSHFNIIHQKTGLAQYFDFVVAYEDVKKTKPDPESYLKALFISGCKKNECVAVEDSERGLLAAKAAGLECWVIPTGLTKDGDFSRADLILSSITEVFRLLCPK